MNKDNGKIDGRNLARKEREKAKKERIKLILKLIKNGIYTNRDIKERLAKTDWYELLTNDTINKYIVEARKIAKTNLYNDYLLNSMFIINELKENYINYISIGDKNNALKVLQEIAKIQGLYDADLRKELFYNDELEQKNEKKEKRTAHTVSDNEIMEMFDD